MQLCIVVTALLLLCASATRTVTAQSSEDDDQSSQTTESESSRQNKLLSITTLDGYCHAGQCSGFRFDNVHEVAFFDLKAEVHIKDTATYDIISPMKYDSLVFTNSTFAHFPLHLFYALNVVELDMRNVGMESVTWECFLSANNLNVLLLSDNNIETIAELTFGYASELGFLFIASNRLRTLYRESFRGLKKLMFLDLAENELQVLPDGMFDYLPALNQINLEKNQLRVIGSEMFAGNALLRVVALQHNNLHELSENAFRAPNGLMLLDISHNSELRQLVVMLQVEILRATNCSLERVNIYGKAVNVNLRDNHILELYFAQPETLETLNLRGNALEQIASLTHAPKLRTLDLSDNPALQSLPYPWQLESLEQLDLSNISLKTLPIAFLSKQTNLRSLNVSHNRLREINPLDFPYLEKLTHFYIHANDWNCYKLNLIMDLLVKYKSISYTRDTFDPDFPGEYVDGIACMYRLDDEPEDADASESPRNDIGRSAALVENPSSSDANMEVAKMRSELKAVVGFYEQKFAVIIDQLTNLERRLKKFENLNSNFWDHITITT